MTTPAATPLLVVSCDRYADLWKPFFDVLRLRWPDCPFPLYLGTNRLVFEDPAVTSLPVGEDLSWATTVSAMLDRLDSDYVIVFLEDIFITQPVDTVRVLRHVEIARDRGAGSVRLRPLSPPLPLPRRSVPGVPELGYCEPGELYRVSAQPAIWRVETLKRLLVPGYSPWDFEILGTAIAERMRDEFWGPYDFTIFTEHAVEKGKWRPQGLEICRAAGVAIDLEARPAMTQVEVDRMYGAIADADAASNLKLEAIEHFRRGERAAGARGLLKLLARSPLSAQLWAFLLFGMLGPSAIASLQYRTAWMRTRRIRRRFERTLRARTA